MLVTEAGPGVPIVGGVGVSASMMSHPRAGANGVQSRAPSELHLEWTRTDRLLATATAWALFGVGVLYVLTTTAGFVMAGGLQAPIVDPAFAVMELLILVEAPLIVMLFVSLHHYAAPGRRSFSLAALGFVVVMTALTLGVHIVVLTVGRQADPSVMPGFDRFFSFTWPSVVYALDIVAWDYCFGLALLLAAPVFSGTGMRQAIRIGLIVAGVLCLAGLLGVVTANMQIRNLGIVGYAIVFPIVSLLMARVFAVKEHSVHVSEPDAGTATIRKP